MAASALRSVIHRGFIAKITAAFAAPADIDHGPSEILMAEPHANLGGVFHSKFSPNGTALLLQMVAGEQGCRMGMKGIYWRMTDRPLEEDGVASDIHLLRRRAEQLLDLVSASTDPQIRSLLLTFTAEMTEEADRLEAIAATRAHD